MTDRSASVLWDGAAQDGRGLVSTGTGALLDYPYAVASRWGEDHRGTNPEELLAAAHAACFTMAFSLACDRAGFATRTIDTQVHVQLSAHGEGFVIDRIALHLRAVVPGLDELRFQAIAGAAKRDCPVSQALSGVAEISLVAVLDPPTPA